MTEEVKKIYEQYRSNQTLYDILGVSQDASFQSIFNARDREVRLSWNNEKDVNRINEAYQILSNPDRRKEYDELLKQAVQISSEPVQAPVEPVQAPAEPVQASAESVQAPAEPVQASAESVQAPAESVQAPAESVQAPAEPVQAPAEPVQAPAEPVQAPVEPVQAPVEPTQTTPKVESTKKEKVLTEEDLKELERKTFNKKQILKGTGVILGSTLFFGPLGTIVSSIIVKKSGKFKLQKTSKTGILKSVKTNESKIIEDFNASLEKDIKEILEKPFRNDMDNYKLAIARAKYQNSVDLLTKRIEFKKDEIAGLGMKAHNKLHLLALKTTLTTSVKWLELMKKKEEAKLNALNNYSTSKNDKLFDLNESIEEVEEELSNPNLEARKKQNNLFKLRRLNAKKLELVKQMSLKRNGISRGQLFLATVNSITNRKNNNIQEEVFEETSEKSR